MAEMRIEPVTVVDQGTTLVDQVGFAVAPGELVALIGPNGAGKTSLLRGLLGHIIPSRGGAMIGGRTLHRLKPAERARIVAWLPQDVPLAWPIKVVDAVALGRFAHGGRPHDPSPEDSAAIATALDFCSITSLANRGTTTLSGGELARVHLARALSSQTPWLFADEPVAALDPAQRVGIMQRLRDHARARQVGMILVLHDLDLAARFCDRLIALRGGKLIADGTADTIITPPVIRALFDVDASVDHAHGWPRLTVAVAPSTS